MCVLRCVCACMYISYIHTISERESPEEETRIQDICIQKDLCAGHEVLEEELGADHVAEGGESAGAGGHAHFRFIVLYCLCV